MCVVQVRETQARLRHHLNRNQMLEGTLVTATMLLFSHSAIIPSLAVPLLVKAVCAALSPVSHQMPAGQCSGTLAYALHSKTRKDALHANTTQAEVTVSCAVCRSISAVPAGAKRTARWSVPGLAAQWHHSRHQILGRVA